MRMNDDGTIDEIVAVGVNFHLEQMDDDCWWMAISLPDGRCLHVNFFSDAHIAINASNQGDDWPEDSREWGVFSNGPKEIPTVPEKYRNAKPAASP